MPRFPCVWVSAPASPSFLFSASILTTSSIYPRVGDFYEFSTLRIFSAIFGDHFDGHDEGMSLLASYRYVAETLAVERDKLHSEMQNSKASTGAGSEELPPESEHQIFVLGSFYTVQTCRS